MSEVEIKKPEIIWQVKCIRHVVEMLNKKIDELKEKLSSVMNDDIVGDKIESNVHTTEGAMIFIETEKFYYVMDKAGFVIKKWDYEKEVMWMTGKVKCWTCGQYHNIGEQCSM